MRSFVAVFKLLLFLIWTLFCIPLQILALNIAKGTGVYTIPVFYHRFVCRIFGLKVITKGQIERPNSDRIVVYAGNHLSYLDIEIISSVLRTSFVAKKEVQSWPLFGFLARLQKTHFINRARPAAKIENNTLQKRLLPGQSLTVFPEGTSTDGQSVQVFKSSFFESFIHSSNKDSIILQPFTLSLISVDGKTPTTQEDRNLYAWHGDMTLLPHLWAFAKTKGAQIEMTFHAPRHAADYTDRKALASACHQDTVSRIIDSAA